MADHSAIVGRIDADHCLLCLSPPVGPSQIREGTDGSILLVGLAFAIPAGVLRASPSRLGRADPMELARWFKTISGVELRLVGTADGFIKPPLLEPSPEPSPEPDPSSLPPLPVLRPA